MDSLKNEISKSLTKILMEGDIVEKAIEKTLTNKINDIVGDVFSYNSEPRKLIENKIEEGVVKFIGNYNFSKNLVSLEQIFDSLLKQVSGESLNIVNKFETFTCYKPPSEIKISKIFNMYKKFIEEKVDIDEDDFEDNSYELEVSYELDGMSDYNSNRTWSSLTYYCIRLRNDYDEKLNRDITLYTWDDMKEMVREKEAEFYIDGGFKTDIKVSELKQLEDIEIKLLSMKSNRTKIILDEDSESDYVEIEREW